MSLADDAVADRRAVFAIGLPWPRRRRTPCRGHAGRDPDRRPGLRRRRRRRSPTRWSRPGRPTRTAASPTSRATAARRAAGLPRLRPLRHERRRRQLRDPHGQAGALPGPGGTAAGAAPRRVGLRARAAATACVTRIYFADEAEANAADPVLATCPADRRDTLLAQPDQRRLPLRHPPPGARRRLSSSRSDGLLGGRSSPAAARRRRTPTPRWLQAMLDVEAALARAWARAGVIPPRPPRRSPAPAGPSVRRRRRSGARRPRHGSRSSRLVARAARGRRRGRGAARRTTARPARTARHRADARRPARARAAAGRPGRPPTARARAGAPRPTASTPMIGRTLLQQALPTTFGLKAAGWMAGLDEAARARGARARRGAGGAARRRGRARWTRPAVVGGVARGSSGWPTRCCRGTTTARAPAALAGALGAPPGVLARSRATSCCCPDRGRRGARGRRGGRGGSSAMAHKRNPVARGVGRGLRGAGPGLVATLLAAMAQEHERAAGAWHAEWEPLRELLAADRLGRRLDRGARRRARGRRLRRWPRNLAGAPGAEDADPDGAAALVARALAARGEA